MIVKPKIRGFICTTAHPEGCAKSVQNQIDYVQSQKPIENGPKNVLIIGSSTGYGLASRITLAFGGSKSSTIGVFFEKSADGKRTATAGYYNSVAVERKAKALGIYAKSFNGDAFSTEMKTNVIETIKKDWDGVDLIVYSLASPRRVHPETGVLSKSVLKPIKEQVTSKTLNLNTMKIEKVVLEQATSDEIDQTVAVMGGEDWQLWIDALEDAGVLNQGAKTVAYSYVGPKITQSIYRNGTIGRAKEHLEETSRQLNQRLAKIEGGAFIAVNKALVTQSSSAIPVIPLYFVVLNKIMDELKVNEDCIMQIYRLFNDFIFTSLDMKVDGKGLIRMDSFEIREDVQNKVNEIWELLNEENLTQYADLEGYQEAFLKLFGFGFDGVDYEADVDISVNIASVD